MKYEVGDRVLVADNIDVGNNIALLERYKPILGQIVTITDVLAYTTYSYMVTLDNFSGRMLAEYEIVGKIEDDNRLVI